MSKLTNVKGRISYIASHARQENLYAVYETTNRKFWQELAKCNQKEFQKSGTEGKCIEARELIIALPESFVEYDPKQLLEIFTEHFKQKHDVECIAALHHNKRKTNYHIHLIFSERRLLVTPEEKVATRNRYYDEQENFVRTKKEVTDEQGKLREGCRVVKKGEVYEKNIFSIKDSRFKSEKFLNEVKVLYTELINLYVNDEKNKLYVFDKSGPYLAMKKIGKNNPKAEIIESDNMARMRWNQTVDRAFVSGIPEEQILKVKKSEISDQVKKSVVEKGNRPFLFQKVIDLAVKALKLVIRKVLHTLYGADDIEKTVNETICAMREYPEKPECLKEYEKLRGIVDKLNVHNSAIYRLENKLNDLEKELGETKGLFKGKQRKLLQEKIDVLKNDIEEKKNEFPEIVQKYGFRTIKEFYDKYNIIREEKNRYEYQVSSWEDRNVPEKMPVSVLERLRKRQEKRKNVYQVTAGRMKSRTERER